MNRQLLIAPLTLLCFLSTNSVLAQDSATAKKASTVSEAKKPNRLDWQQLSPLQQTVLASLESDWSSFTPASKIKWLKVADRYPAMTTAEQER